MKALFIAMSFFIATSISFARSQVEKTADTTIKAETQAPGCKKDKKACCAKKTEAEKKDCPANAKSENGNGKKKGHSKSETK